MKNQRPTPNAQRPTPKVLDRGATYDLEERLLDFASRIIKLCDSLPGTRAGNEWLLVAKSDNFIRRLV